MAGRSARLVAVLLLALLALGGAAGCGAIVELARLQTRVEGAGYNVDGVNHNSSFGFGSEVSVIASTRELGSPPPEGNLEIAGIVWQTYPRRFDTVAVQLDGVPDRFDRGQLAERFGQRDPALDARDFNDDVRSGFRGAAIAGAIVLAVAAAAIVTTIVLVRRRNRNRPPPPPQYGPPPGPPMGWAPPPPPPPPPTSPPSGWPPPPVS